MGRPLFQRGNGPGNRCCQGLSTRQDCTRLNFGSALLEFPNPSSKFLSRERSIAGNDRQLRFLAGACFS